MAKAHARSERGFLPTRAAAFGPYAYGNSLCRFVTNEYFARSPVSSNPSLLDVCCGSGDLARVFLSSGWDVVGLDPSETLLTLARDTCHASVADGRFRTACDPFVFPHEQTNFDLVVALDDADVHLGSLDAVLSFLQQSLAGLRLGGHVVFRVVNIESSPSPSLILALMRDTGFHASWTASPPFPEDPVVDPPLPFRGIYVGRRDI